MSNATAAPVTAIRVDGMSCGHCEGRVVKALRAVPGVEWATASHVESKATVGHAPGVTAAALVEAVVAAGYEAMDGGDANEPPIRPAAPSEGVPPAADAAPTTAITIPIAGMTCAACVTAVERALFAVPGVDRASVNLMLARAEVGFDPARADRAALVAAVEAAGYAVPTEAGAGASGASHRAAAGAVRGERIAIAATLAAGCATMVGAMPLMHGAAHRDDPLAAWWLPLDSALRRAWPALYALDPTLLRWALWALCTAVIVGPARGFFVRAWHAARRGATDMNTLVALGTGAAWAVSTAATLAPDALAAHGIALHAWYDAVPWVPGFVLLGRHLEGLARSRAREGTDALARLLPRTAVVLRDGGPVPCDLADVRAGDVVRVAAGAQVPVDGVVVAGESGVDESLVTGESLPVRRGPGDRALGGTAVVDGALDIRVTATGSDALVAQIAAQVEAALLAKPRLHRIADRAAALFTPVVIALAATAAAVWWIATGSIAHALVVGTSVVIVACPCALGLAVPAAVLVATGRAARLGLLVRNGAVLERAGRVDAVVFDKTGTLTQARPQVVAESWAADAGAAARVAVAAVAARSHHPLAAAVARHLRAQSGGSAGEPEVSEVEVAPARGVEARVLGARWRLGAPAWVGSGAHAAGEDPTASQVGAACAGEWTASFALVDAVRPTARGAVARLRAGGCQVWLATGDRDATAARVAQEVGIDLVRAALLPADKIALVRQLQAEGRTVAMVGDGVNDGPALAAADVAIAIGDGSAVAVGQADVTLLRPDLEAVPVAIGLARATDRILRQNLAWAFGYNILAVPLAAGALYPWTGSLPSPMIASAAMALSSVCVVANALRLRRWRPAVEVR